jgi:hypothetical protein
MDQDMSKTPEEVIAEYQAQQKVKNANKLKIALAILAGFVILSFIGSSTDSDGDSSYVAPAVTTTTPDYDDSWIPAGFDGYTEDDNIAWRWATKSEVDCTYSSGACWSAVVIAKEGCPSSLYGEVNIFDKNDIQISYTNDTVGSVQPMQKVKLTFDTLDDSAQTANISKFSCY